MTVKELKKALKGLPGDAHIVIANHETRRGRVEIARVERDYAGAVSIETGTPCDSLFKIARRQDDL